jgi:Flp pilus assembly protein TadD
MANRQYLAAIVAAVAILSFAGNSVGVAGQQNRADISGGAALIFKVRPKNPPIRQKVRRPIPVKADESIATSKPDPKIDSTNNDLSDEAEDALVLGNSARDAQPPRYAEAEKAYRLAAKLNPDDPRPYMGLANIWYDQKHFEEAATMYREAARRMTSNAALAGGSLPKPIVRGEVTNTSPAERGELRAYLGTSLLQQGQFAEAVVELRNATTEDPTNAHSHALLGYTFLEQKKYSQASRAFERAVELSPGDPEYRELLRRSTARKKSEVRR